VIDETCYICFLSDTYEGKAHDKSLADLVGYTLPAGSCLDQDLGFQGFVLAGVTIVQPKKKLPRGRTLPAGESHQSADLVDQNPRGTRYWWGETLSDRTGCEFCKRA